MKDARRARVTRLGTIVAVVVVAVVAIAFFTGRSNDNAAAKPTTTISGLPSSTIPPDPNAASTTVAPGAVTPAVLAGPGPGASITGDTPCPKADGSSPRSTGFAKAPPDCLTKGKKYTATFESTKGKIVVALDANAAPKTVNNFVVLARYHFFDGQPIFRLVKDFAGQFGDPSATPSNSAKFGYTIPDELPAKGAYKVGSLVMANTGSPNSGGAQMFFVLGAQGVGLPPSYSLFGDTTEGLETIAAINAVPSTQITGNDGAPSEQVTFTKVTVTES